MKNLRSLSIDRFNASLSGAVIAGALTFGRSTSTPAFINGAVTMKMISRTSMTSTIGVTLMSAIAFFPPRPPTPDIAVASTSGNVTLHDVQKVRRKVLHLRREDGDGGI